MSNVFEVPQGLFDTETGDDDMASGLWYLKREDLPEGLLALIGEGKALEVKIYLEHPESDDYDSETPFQVELHVNALDERFDRTPLAVARRSLAVAHLWKHQMNVTHIQLALRRDWLPSGKTHKEICDLLVTQMLRSVLFNVPKLTIRWDDHGLVAFVNFARTFISTREHQVKE